MTTLAELGADLALPDAETGRTVRSRRPDVAEPGRLADIAAWLADVQGEATAPHQPKRVRVLRFGYPADAPPPAAGGGDIRNVPTHGTDISEAIQFGAEVADDEVDRGADLLVLVVAHSGVSAEVITAALTNTEPVKVLPRGAALPPETWMARAEQVRDGRRRAMAARGSADELVATVGDVDIAAAAALLLRAAARRTAALLDGLPATAAALVAFDANPGGARWWRVADTSGQPADEAALGALGQRALLELGVGLVDGTAGLLAATVAGFAVDAARPG